MILDATTKSLEFKLGGAVASNQIPFASFWSDRTTTTNTPGESDGTSNNATAVTVVSAPGASTQRAIKEVYISNTDSSSVTVTVQINNNSTLRVLFVITLAVNDTLCYTDVDGWSVINTSGQKKSSVTANAGTNLNTSALALETGGNLAAATTALQVIDDWDESDRAKVNPIAGQAGVQGGSGAVSALTQRVCLATDVALPAGTNLLGYVSHGKTLKTASGSLTADTDIVSAVASKRIKVIAYSLISVGTNANTVIFKSNGTGGTELWRVLLQSSTAIAAGVNLATSAPSFLFATVAGEKLTMDVNQTDTIHYSITYFDDDAT